MYLLIAQRLAFEALLDIIYFPLWWYTGGLKHALLWCVGVLKRGNQSLAPGLWLKNIFVPMYGQYDWQGKIISFFMRLAQVVFRTSALLVWLGFCCVLFMAWMVFPIVVVYGLGRSFRII
ncbi:MAG: hypothetical protein EXS55_04555 [Candidatus Magasanikbacteria bacterium]|nr:hypothetical protein [Candidatus Magasanikbacteria bacterium]